MNQLPENSLRIYDVTLVTSYLIGLCLCTMYLLVGWFVQIFHFVNAGVGHR